MTELEEIVEISNRHNLTREEKMSAVYGYIYSTYAEPEFIISVLRIWAIVYGVYQIVKMCEGEERQ